MCADERPKAKTVRRPKLRLRGIGLICTLLIVVLATQIAVALQANIEHRREILARIVDHLGISASVLGLTAKYEALEPDPGGAIERIQDHLSIPVPWGGSLGCICDQQGNALAFSPALPFQRGQSIANLRLASLTARGREVSLSDELGSPQRLPYLATVARDGPLYLIVTSPVPRTTWTAIAFQAWKPVADSLPGLLDWTDWVLFCVLLLSGLALVVAVPRGLLAPPRHRGSGAMPEGEGADCPGPVIVVKAGSGEIIVASGDAVSLLGDDGGLEGVPLGQLSPEWAQPRVARLLEAARTEGTGFEHELPVLRSDGAVAWVDATSRLRRDGESDTIICLYHDITERRHMERELARTSEELRGRNAELQEHVERLAESEALYRSLFTQDLDGVILIDPETRRITDAKPQACATLRYAMDEITGSDIRALIAPDRLGEYHRAARQLASGNPVKVFGAQWLRADGSRVDIDVTAAVVRYGDRRVIQVVFRDVTSRRQMERALEERNEQLRKTTDAKSRFLATTSHEIRTPLNAIVGFSELLSDSTFGELNERQADFARNIHEASEDLLNLIADVLDLSKVDAGRMRLTIAPTALSSVLESTGRIVRGMARDTGITVSVSVDPPDLVVAADAQRLKQVLYNLLANAIRYSPEGGEVRVEARVVGDMAEVSVTDHGRGVPPEHLENIFEEYYRVLTTDTEKAIAGTGLGLPLTRRLVQMHGGELTVTSEVGKGSTFTFTIPIARQEEEA